MFLPLLHDRETHRGVIKYPCELTGRGDCRKKVEGTRTDAFVCGF